MIFEYISNSVWVRKMNIENQKIISLFDSIAPIIILVTLLYINVSIFGDDSLDGSNQLFF